MIAAAAQQSSIGGVSAVYAMGAPKVGDASWAQMYSGLGLNDITYRHGRLLLSAWSDEIVRV